MEGTNFRDTHHHCYHHYTIIITAITVPLLSTPPSFSSLLSPPPSLSLLSPLNYHHYHHHHHQPTITIIITTKVHKSVPLHAHYNRSNDWILDCFFRKASSVLHNFLTLTFNNKAFCASWQLFALAKSST